MKSLFKIITFNVNVFIKFIERYYKTLGGI